MDQYPDVETTVGNLEEEQDSDPAITMIHWLETDSAPTLNIYFTGVEQKYLKQLGRSFLENGMICRRDFAHDRKMVYKQLPATKTLPGEFMYILPNAPTGGHLGRTHHSGFQKTLLLPN